VTTLQQWWLHEEPYERLVRETTRCTLDAGGRLRCDGECPTLALAGSPPPLDCAALASFDWGTLSRGRDVLDEWGGWDDEFQQEVAEDHLGIEGADYHPVAIRRIEVGDRTLTVLEPVPDKWVLLHEHVPLLASSQPIRVGLAPGGVYASSSSDGAQRIHRLLLDTHEIEPVLPGPCG
jgi:hypothetical protein